MAIQIGAKPDSGFDNPIGMLKDCHRRIESFLEILSLVVERSRGRALSAEESKAVQTALHYFRTGGKRHTADEEESLFPRLRAVASDSLEEIDRLTADHLEAHALHDSIERLYLEWIAKGELNAADGLHLHAEIARLKELYAAHIHVEETTVFARAYKVLDSRTLAAIGTEFRFRRK